MPELTDIPQNVLNLIPRQKMFEHNILPLRIESNQLYIRIPDIGNQRVLNEIKFLTGLRIIPEEYPADQILNSLQILFPEESSKNNGNGNGSTINTKINDGSTIDFVNQIITSAVKSRASDIHFEVLEDSARVRFRIDGHLRESYTIDKDKSPAISSRLKIMANLDISEKRRPQDGRIRFEVNKNNIDIRVSTIPASFGEKIVLRILDKTQLRLDLEKLGLTSHQREILQRSLDLPYGMILVTGPTGSGKTTSLYAALQHIHTVDKNIMTVEDPIEYNLSGINQCNVKTDIGFDFASALRSFLRQDPDVIMVGEIRDRETAEIGIRASLTGHLVFSTLHTNDAVSCITRLTDMGIEPFLVASSVKLIIAQRLVRKLCSCKSEITDDPFLEKNGIEKGYIKNGCHKCNFTGYSGRIALFEILEVTEELSTMISNHSSENEIKKKALESGLKTLRDSGIEKIKNGITSYEEVLRETLL